MTETQKRLISGFSIAFIYIFAISIDITVNTYFIPIFLFILISSNMLYKEACLVIGKKYGSQLQLEYMIHLLGSLYVFINYLKCYNIIPKLTQNITWLKINTFLIQSEVTIFFILILIFISFTYFIITSYNKEHIFYLAEHIFFFFYFYVLISYLFKVHSLESGIFYVWIVSWATIMSDVSAYFVGRYFGKHKIGFELSPNKTYEGYFIGLLAQIILNFIFYYTANSLFEVPEIHSFEIIIYSFVIFLFSIIGDLGESLWKRNHAIKDSGTSISGHGGMFDLLDALILTIPSFYFTYQAVLFFKEL